MVGRRCALDVRRMDLPLRWRCLCSVRTGVQACDISGQEPAMSILMTALGLTILLCLLLGWALYRTFTNMELIRKQEADRREEWIEEKKELDRYLTGVLRVLNTNVGGISKRISESAEIAEVLQAHAPDLFKQCEGLAYWLHANDRFLVSLYAVAAEGIDKGHRRRVHEMKKIDRDEVFERIYVEAGMPAPTI